MNEIREKIAASRERVRQLERLETLIASARSAAGEQRGRLSILQARLMREERDVRRCESMSIVALLHYFLGDAEQRANRERQEAAAAALKCAESQSTLKKLETEIAELEKQRAALGNPRAEFDDLMQAKERAMRAAGDDNSRRLLGIAESIGDAQADIQDLTEAIKAGELAKDRLDSAFSQLNSACGWGTFDMLGGGLMTTAIKHARIDGARQEAHRAQHALAKFNRELADVKARLDEDGAFELGGLATFADYFIDGIIADWIVQSKINRSLSAVGDVRNKVDVLLQRLDRRRDAARRALERLQAEKCRVIEMA